MCGDEIIMRYRIDASRSRFTVQAFADGLLSVFGHSPTMAICGFGGDAHFAPDAPDHPSLLILVQANSLAVTDKVSAKDRTEMERAIREDVLETTRYPEITFFSTSVAVNQTADGAYSVKLTGDLSLHGVTRRQLIDAQMTVNEDSLRARGEFPLQQANYNIKTVSVGAGMLKVKDELKLSFDISAIADFGMRNAD